MDERLIVGFDSADDAAVFKVSDDIALIQTLDFFPTMVPDPYIFGKVAAANALSDVYAMGGTPITAMNIVAFPQDGDMEMLAEIMRGGAEVVADAKCVLAGGHSISDATPKYGLSVTGLVHPDKVIMNNSTQAGDVLITTKPLGSGIVTGAYRNDKASHEAYEEAIKWMTTLNRDAGEVMLEYPVSSATDVTGFGLLGHLHEMMRPDITAIIYADQLPYIEEAFTLGEQGVVTGGSKRNRKFLANALRFDDVEKPYQELLLDPQTSGGLLMSVPKSYADEVTAALKSRGVPAAVIGEVIERKDIEMIVKPSK